MSQVIINQDKLDARRKASATQEHAIDVEVMTHRRMSNPLKKDLFASLVGYLVMPILAAWSLLTAVIYVVISAFRFLLQGIGKVVGGTKSIIIGESTKK